MVSPAPTSASPSSSPDDPTSTLPPQRPSGDVSTVVRTSRAPGGTTNGCRLGVLGALDASRRSPSAGARATTSVTVEPSGTRAPGCGVTASSVPGSTLGVGPLLDDRRETGVRSACAAALASRPSSAGTARFGGPVETTSWTRAGRFTLVPVQGRSRRACHASISVDGA